MSSLSWAWDGDLEAQIQGHSISSEQHQHPEPVYNSDTEHDHHCSMSAHLTVALLSGFSVPSETVNQDTSPLLPQTYLSQIVDPGFRPPIT